MENAKVYQLSRHRVSANQPAPTASVLPSSAKPKLLDQVRQAIRTRHYSYMTEKAYVHWIKRFIFFHNKRHPAEMGEKKSEDFFRAWPPNYTSARPPRTKPSMPSCFSTVRF